MTEDFPKNEDREMNGLLWHVEQRVVENWPCFFVRKTSETFGTTRKQQNYVKRTNKKEQTKRTF